MAVARTYDDGRANPRGGSKHHQCIAAEAPLSAVLPARAWEPTLLELPALRTRLGAVVSVVVVPVAEASSRVDEV